MKLVESSQDRFAAFVAGSCARNAKQGRFALLLALVIAVLLWRTQWLSLRPGLWILLAGQAIVAVLLLTRTSHFGGDETIVQMMGWFDREERFVTLSALAESLVRIVGFAVLAYGFWNATHLLWITLILGVAYPIFSYFGVARRNTRQVLRSLAEQRQQIA